MNFVKIMLDLQDELNNFRCNKGYAAEEYFLYPEIEMLTVNSEICDCCPPLNTVRAWGGLKVSFCDDDFQERFFAWAKIEDDNSLSVSGDGCSYKTPDKIKKEFPEFIKAFWKHLQEKHKA